MAEPRLVDPHDPVMTGENSFVRFSNDGGNTIPERVSHWRVLWSPAGQGHVMYIDSTLLGSKPRIYADNAGVARFIQRTIESLLHKPFADEALPIVDAKFERTRYLLTSNSLVLLRGTPAKTFEGGLNERTVVSEWPSLEQAIAAYESPAYKEALRALGNGAERDIRIVEGPA